MTESVYFTIVSTTLYNRSRNHTLEVIRIRRKLGVLRVLVLCQQLRILLLDVRATYVRLNT